jgi:branched-chain amino acid transport system substrate-binding protein
MRRRAFIAACLAGVLSLTAVGCAAQEGTAANGAIPIGVNIELTGPASLLGASYKNALDLVVADINRQGVLDGRKLELIVRDNRSDPAEATRVAKNLWDNEQIVAMVGPGVSPTSVPVAQEAEGRQVPLVSMASSGAVVNPVAERRYSFKTPPNNDIMAEVQARELTERKVEKVAYLAPANAYGDASEEAFRAAAGQAGLEIAGVERFDDRDKDYTVPVTKLAGNRPQAFAVAAISPQSSLVAKAIRTSGFAGPVIFEAGAGAELFLEGAGTASEGMLMVHPSILAVGKATGTSPEVQARKEFFRDYSSRYGQFSGFASYAADALAIIVRAIEEAGSTDPRKIRDALERQRYEGLTGRFEFSGGFHGGVAKDALAVLTVRNGKWVLAGG